jgi:hypothetical protein
LDETTKKTRNDNYRARYPEIRGLRYITSTRKYCGRDYASAGCIARLAAYKLVKGTKQKPAPFCRGKVVDDFFTTIDEIVDDLVDEALMDQSQ